MVTNLHRLRIFVTVVDQGGYSAAGRQLDLAQATVSHHIGELQKELGMELLRYEHQAILLTPAGEETYRAARTMLREQEHLVESLRALARGRRGRVRFGATMAFEQQYFFDQVIGPFCRRHRGVLLSMRFGHSRQQAQAVLDHDIDLAYVIRWHLPLEVHFEPLHEAELRFLVPQNHPLTHRPTVTVEDIAAAGLITAPLSSLESVYYDQLLQERGFATRHPVLEVAGIQARVFAVEAGLGVFATFYPDYAPKGAFNGLVPLPVEGPSTRVEVGLALRPDGQPNTGVELFASWLREFAVP